VDPSGGGDYATIQEAVDAADEGDTILLADGTFTGPGNVDITWQDKGLVFMSASGDRDACVIDCGGAAGFVFENSAPFYDRSLSFVGFSVIGATTAISVVGQSPFGEEPSIDLELTNCSFRGGGVGLDLDDCRISMELVSVYGNTEAGIDATHPFDLVANHCVIRGNGIGLSYYAGWYCPDDWTVEIDATEIVANGVGISYWQETYGTKLTHCRIDSSTVGSGIQAAADFEFLDLEDCSLRFNAGCGIANDGGGIAIRATRCNISDNGQHGIAIPDFYSAIDLDDTDLTGNLGWGVGKYDGPYRERPNPLLRNELDQRDPAEWIRINDTNILGNALGGVYVHGIHNELSIENSLIADNAGCGLDLLAEEPVASWTMADVTIVINSGHGIAVSCDNWSATNLLIAFNSGLGVELVGDSIVDLACCDLYGNTGGDWIGPIASQFGASGNLSVDPEFCDVSAGDYTLNLTSPCALENNVECGQIGARPVGCDDATFAVTYPDDTPESAPTAFALGPCRPNPFNPSTVIEYTLPEQVQVRLRVYDLAGRLVETLVKGESQARGVHRATWMGRDSQGRAVPSGTYLYRLEAGEFTAMRRMALIR